MKEIELSAGRIRFRDTGDGPPIVFVHGLVVNGTLWQKVIDELGSGFRCIAPNWPLGSHSIPMSADADVSPLGVARLIREFLEALDLRDVTLVANDTGGAVAQLLLADGCDRVGRVVLTPCDSFDNFLPKSIRGLQYIARVPGLTWLAVQPARIRAIRPTAYRSVAKHDIDDDVLEGWVRPFLTDKGIRSDLTRFLRAIDYRDTVAAAERLRSFDKPVLLLWARNAPFFPFAHAERWAEILPDARIVEVPDSHTFVSLDQPEFTAREIATFVRAHQNA
ncbi:alpha/beta fold hydrolase [Antrihabitans stalactiti]|uniref:Alpha/beta hydrolase n=1 Tax=Antrihabitans stalactiti TaxID=2584121 RepID=A0A848KRG6_9NOCA|nr:alpha/beta hydrolase [Antrihabitans stalactiti]NMN99474.1 alpha/beta hydrolase [Antrihabitans stalactiti]